MDGLGGKVIHIVDVPFYIADGNYNVVVLKISKLYIRLRREGGFVILHVDWESYNVQGNWTKRPVDLRIQFMRGDSALLDPVLLGQFFAERLEYHNWSYDQPTHREFLEFADAVTVLPMDVETESC
jgi:hypothetical protein